LSGQDERAGRQRAGGYSGNPLGVECLRRAQVRVTVFELYLARGNGVIKNAGRDHRGQGDTAAVDRCTSGRNVESGRGGGVGQAGRKLRGIAGRCVRSGCGEIRLAANGCVWEAKGCAAAAVRGNLLRAEELLALAVAGGIAGGVGEELHPEGTAGRAVERPAQHIASQRGQQGEILKVIGTSVAVASIVMGNTLFIDANAEPGVPMDRIALDGIAGCGAVIKINMDTIQPIVGDHVTGARHRPADWYVRSIDIHPMRGVAQGC